MNENVVESYKQLVNRTSKRQILYSLTWLKHQGELLCLSDVFNGAYNQTYSIVVEEWADQVGVVEDPMY